MIAVQSSLWALAVACAAACAPALAASSGASSVSDSIGTSVGSLSQSLQNSSASSSRPANVADGDYRILEVAAAPARPGMVQLTLEPVAPGAAPGVRLTLPQRALDDARLHVGDVVAARQRDYGIEFADARTRQAFFLVLTDAWYEELQTRAVVL